MKKLITIAVCFILGSLSSQASGFGIRMNNGGAMFSLTLLLGTKPAKAPLNVVKGEDEEGNETYGVDAEDGVENKKKFHRKDNPWMYGTYTLGALGLGLIIDKETGSGGGRKSQPMKDVGRDHIAGDCPIENSTITVEAGGSFHNDCHTEGIGN